MKSLIKYFITIFFLIIVFAPFKTLGARSIIMSENNLTPEETEFLNTAYKDEAKCQYYFQKIKEKFPDAGFTKILNSEQNHVITLEGIYNHYEIAIPQNLDFSALVIPATLEEACRTGLKYENENVEMYKNFLTSVTDKYLKTVFEDLRDITINRNIPAVEKCK